jgi:hypothetical protein
MDLVLDLYELEQQQKKTYVQSNKEGELKKKKKKKTDTQAQTAVNPNIQQSTDKHVDVGWFQAISKPPQCTGMQRGSRSHSQVLRHSVDMAGAGEHIGGGSEREKSKHPAKLLTNPGRVRPTRTSRV